MHPLVVRALAFVCILIPPLVLTLWCWRRRFSPEFAPDDCPRGWFVVSFLSVISFGLILVKGLDYWLAFIPGSWGGTDEYGEFVSARESLGFLFGVCASFGVLCLLIQWGSRPKK
jgi:hypothetical protein